MSRSTHTDPLRIRAVRRVHAPFAPRRKADRSGRRRAARALKERGIVLQTLPPVEPESARLPRIVEHAPPPGWHHPAGRTAVARLLDSLDDRFRYKLRSVELCAAPSVATRSRLLLGRLVLPGRIILYAQPRSPWLLLGAPSPAELAQLRCSGAIVTCHGRAGGTEVIWPDHTLRDFMLADVFLHELAHHLLQVARAKPGIPVARTRDHEAFAQILVRRWRRQVMAVSSPG